MPIVLPYPPLCRLIALQRGSIRCGAKTRVSISMRIAIFDYFVTATNPAGSCHRLLLDRLGKQYDFTVFANRFDNPQPQCVGSIHVPAVVRPLAALFVSFHVMALIRYLSNRHTRHFSLVQSIESNFGFSDVVYAHFCHRWFLRNRWQRCRPQGLRRFTRILDHALHAAVEPWVLRRAQWIIAASSSLARQIKEEYPFAASKIRIIPNAVDLDRIAPAATFDRASFRRDLHVADGDLLVLFIALGQFERKGLPILLKAMKRLREPRLKLCVIGGTPSLIGDYRKRVDILGLTGSVQFTGLLDDVRPHLWAADLFALPSLYEVFSLAVLQAAAARLPLLLTPDGGGEALGGNGCLLVQPDEKNIARRLADFCAMPPEDRVALGESAHAEALKYSVNRFIAAWNSLYREIGEAKLSG